MKKVESIRLSLNDPKWRPPPLQVVTAMVQHGRVELLAHPLSQKYLQMKWNSYGKYFHIANLLVYSIFLIFVTMYSTCLMQSQFGKDFVNETTINSTNIDSRLNSTDSLTSTPQKINLSTLMCVSGLIIFFYIMASTLREIVQFSQQRYHYLFDPNNFVSWLLYVHALIMISPLFLGGQVCDYLFSAASLTVFFSWFNLLLHLQRFDQIGIYVVMFLEILQTLIKVLILFSILIIAFGLAFFILLSNIKENQTNHLSFSTIPMSLMRTFSMMLGEMDYVGVFVTPMHHNYLPNPYATFAVLFLFMILMPILLMNLLIGLAVGDIESVKRNAQLKRLAMQVILHSELERKLPQMWLEKVDKTELIEYPNEDKCKVNLLDAILRKWFCNPFTESENAGLELVLDNSTEDVVINEIEKQKLKLREISKQMEQQSQLLRLIVQKMEIKSESDDVDEGVQVRENRPLSAIASSEVYSSRWNSPRIRKRMSAMKSLHKSISSN